MKTIKKVIIAVLYIIALSFLIRAEYIPDPILLIHGSGAHASDREDIHNGQSTKSFLQQYF